MGQPTGIHHHPGQLWRDIDRVDPPKRPAAERVADFNEIYSLLDATEVQAQASRCIQCPVPTCLQGCPLSNRIPEERLPRRGRRLRSGRPRLCGRTGQARLRRDDF
ncbi:MAG: hypothetical protein NTZ16_04900 [Verrucomicrobia bacterium]|nr:hypothetical protein [Verrucomicrobiota bacterium]